MGVSTTRELREARVRFVPRAGGTLLTSETTVPLETVSGQWFPRTEALPYGGQFQLTLPFTFQGSGDALESVLVTLVNTAGTSAELRAAY